MSNCSTPSMWGVSAQSMGKFVFLETKLSGLFCRAVLVVWVSDVALIITTVNAWPCTTGSISVFNNQVIS